MTDDDVRQMLALYRTLTNPEAQRWNCSTDNLALELSMRLSCEALVRSIDVDRAINIGIGAGGWDDWLGFLLEDRAALSSIDIDETCVCNLALRQRFERHPNPSTAWCYDMLLGPDNGAGYALVTLVGSTIREIGDTEAALDALALWVAPGGHLFLHWFVDDIAGDDLVSALQGRAFTILRDIVASGGVLARNIWARRA